VLAGYRHIVAMDISEAIDMAKANPIFNDIRTQIEVHLMKVVGA
jgi:hypothetical protein